MAVFRRRALRAAVVVVLLGVGACADADQSSPPVGESANSARPESETASADSEGMRVQPPVASPGATVKLHFPEDTWRGVPYALERKTETGWSPQYLLLSHPPRAQGSWVAWDDIQGWEERAYHDPEPDPVEIPPPAAPGSYRICSLPEREFCDTIRIESHT